MRALSRVHTRSFVRYPLLLTSPRRFFSSNVRRIAGMPGFGTALVTTFGLAGVSWMILDRLYLEPQREKKVKRALVEMDKVRTFEQFLSGDHIPYADARYAIDRKDKEVLLKTNILKSARIPQVVNVVAPIELGKSYLLKKVAKQIDAPYKVFYLDGAKTLREYFKSYQWDFPSERDVISELFLAIKKYHKSNRKEKIIVILDSPGGIVEAVRDTDKTLDFLITLMKTSVANSEATFYCISSRSKNIFTPERVRTFGEGRFEQIEEKQWIDMSLSTEEMVALIDEYEKNTKEKVNEEARTKLLSHNVSKIGILIKMIANIN